MDFDLLERGKTVMTDWGFFTDDELTKRKKN